jgi:hypothetical protein
MDINWSEIPEKYNYCAVDCDRTVHLYSHEPILGSIRWFQTPNTHRKFWFMLPDTNVYLGDVWKTMLYKRNSIIQQ